MKTTGKTLMKNVLNDAMTQNFDDLFFQDEKEVNKQVEYEQNRKGKEVQLLAKMNQIQMRTTKAQIDYRKSLIDPTKDTIELAIEIRALQEEYKIAESVYQQLFPKK